LNKARLEAFSDGIFAIAITLLVLTISQPSNYHDLGHELASRWPSFAAYVVSFAVIGIMWLNHHSIFSHIGQVDRGLILFNLLLLLTIAFLPYPTGVFGQALREQSGTTVAAVFYSCTMAVNALAWAALWLYASTNRRLLVATFPESERHMATLLFTIGTFAYILAVGVAFLSPIASLTIQGVFAVYYALDPVSRRVARSSNLKERSS
jgi:uncharacterized membrane protein